MAQKQRFTKQHRNPPQQFLPQQFLQQPFKQERKLDRGQGRFKPWSKPWLKDWLGQRFIIKLKNRLEKLRQAWHQHQTVIKLSVTALIIIIISAISSAWYFWEPELLSPLSSLSNFHFLGSEARGQALDPNSQQTKLVYGFLPYWNVNKAKIQPELTHLSYFGLGIDSDGTIITRTAEGTHPGYSKLDSDQLLQLIEQTRRHGGQFDLTLVQFNPGKIESIINSPQAHQNLINSLESILLAYPVKGINIDIEYNGKASDELRHNFVQLLAKLDAFLAAKFPQVELSIDMYASASSEGNMIWDIEQIGRYVDYIVVMAYDFHRRGSTQAGPVAPLFGGKKLWSSDIHQHLLNYLRLVPKEKILLGVPFYGYEWRTDSRSPQANTYPDSGSTASYQRVQKILKQRQQLQVQTAWDDTALCPYLSYVEDGEIFMIYYENPLSLSFKLEYVQQLDLAGIAIWALGYEGDDRALWNEVQERI
jgi:spore germination protein YaaH